MDDRRALGFTAIALGVITFAGPTTAFAACTFDKGTLQPNAAYFAHADQADAMAARAWRST